jgi:hypothetical protein
MGAMTTPTTRPSGASGLPSTGALSAFPNRSPERGPGGARLAHGPAIPLPVGDRGAPQAMHPLQLGACRLPPAAVLGGRGGFSLPPRPARLPGARVARCSS